LSSGLFEIVVAMMIQTVFCLEYFLKIIFNINTSKQYKTIKKNYFKLKKIII